MKKEIKDFIERVARYNSEVLKIYKPRIRYVEGLMMGTPTTKAEASNSGEEIKINRDYKWDRESKEGIFVYISHEMRHCWQAQRGYYAEWFNRYQKSTEIGIEKYNEQEVEVDAWAWALFMVKINYGVDIVLNEEVFSEKAREKIKEQERRIEEEYRKGEME